LRNRNGELLVQIKCGEILGTVGVAIFNSVQNSSNSSKFADE
jgi:hypothetical protein